MKQIALPVLAALLLAACATPSDRVILLPDAVAAKSARWSCSATSQQVLNQAYAASEVDRRRRHHPAGRRCRLCQGALWSAA